MVNPATDTTSKTINIFDKTIFKKFPTWQAFWNQAKTALLSVGVGKTEKDKVNAYYFTWKVYDYWKYNIYYGYSDQFYNKIFTRIALAFIELSRHEKLYKDLFEKVRLQGDKAITLTDITTHTPGLEQEKLKKTGMTVDRKWENEGKEQAQVKSVNRNKPNSAVDLIAGEYGIENRADWLQTEMETAYGLRSKEGDKIKFSPNWATGKGHYHDKTNTIDDKIRRQAQSKTTVKRQEQPNYTQQIANIIRSFALSETNITEWVVDYMMDLFYNNTIYMPPGADFKWDSNAQAFTYIKRGTIDDEEVDDQGKPKKPKGDTDRITWAEYSRLRENGEAVEDSLDLENLVRQRNFRLASPLKDPNRQATMIRGMNGLVWAWTRGAYWPEINEFDKVMGAITGFKEFKAELRTKTEIAQYYLDIGEKPPQTFYCLLGKPGVGKSQISKTLSEAYNRPFNILGMAGQAHPKILKGMRPTLDGAKYGKIVESFVDCKANIFITKDQHQAELARLQAKPKKTKNQEEYIKWLQTEIKDIETQEKEEGKIRADLVSITPKGIILVGRQQTPEQHDELKAIEADIIKAKLEKKLKDLHGKYYDLPSKAPVILLDESEKVKEETVLFIMGQICDRELNYSYDDDFLEYPINLSEAMILVTANYAERVPDFVRSRCKFVNIQLLTYKERLNILQIRRDIMIRQYFKAPRFEWENPNQTDREIDKYNKKRSRIAPLIIERDGTVRSDYNDSTIYLTDEQQRIKELISDDLLELCITETFGIREGITNLVLIIEYLVKAKIKGAISKLGDPITDYSKFLPKDLYMPIDDQAAGTGHDFTTGAEREDMNDPDPLKDGEGLINLTYECMKDGNGDKEPLSIIKKRDIEWKKPQKANEGIAECVLNLVPTWNGYNRYDPNWKPKRPTPPTTE